MTHYRTPKKDEGLYEFAGRAKFDRLLSGIVLTRAMASLMPASWNQIVAWPQQIDGLRRAA